MSVVQWVYSNGSCWVALDSVAQNHIESLWSLNSSSWILSKSFPGPVYIDIDEMVLVCDGVSYKIARHRT
jgi:hypothetical protein